MTTLEQRLAQLDKQFEFKENPEDFNFELNPERLAYKNEALRTGDRDLYVSYLAERYPNQLGHEMTHFDSIASSLIQISKEDAEQLFLEKKTNLLKSDLSYKDPDAIFQMKNVANEDLNWHLDGHETDILNVNSTPNEALDGKESIWLVRT
ncbi:MAG: hypothetical protein ACTJHT_08425 [Sphingobacterium sp.]|uniref:hypothetical protein n=1 Tax=Sphingobacterium sp. JB170 TaxID=1434842 RepID=UPI00097F69A1|nr:hypothetical protein [Sphingobacterium sp. JB170]SJN36183.1 hypothetical protein FM107_08750 [Sphingobacterium sp. JB170]